MPHRPKVTYDAPLLCVDLPICDDDACEEPYQIWPCDQCLPWHLEVVPHDFYPLNIAAREWHAADCPQLQEALSQIRDHGDED